MDPGALSSGLTAVLDDAGGGRQVAIVGLGSWGLCVLERLVDHVRRSGTPAQVHVIEPGDPGGGVYARAQPDYLVLNNPCGQLSLYAAPTSGPAPRYGLGLFGWARRRGYQWFGHECRIGPGGRDIEPTDYLPRRLMGEYLAWFFDALVADAPAGCRITLHRRRATDIVATRGERERVVLDDGSSLEVDHVILTSGHTFNQEEGDEPSATRSRRPYPVEFFAERPDPGEAVAISGMGLVAADLVAAFTVGRGGRFEPAGGPGRLRYLPSGDEPVLYLYSRTGVPSCAKSAHGLDPTGEYEPVVCTPDAFAAMRRAGAGCIDFRADVLPLLLAEMQARYFFHAAFLSGGDGAAAAVRAELRAAWSAGRFPAAVERLSVAHGSFDPAQVLFAGAGVTHRDAEAYQRFVQELVGTDLDEALAPGGSPVKAAMEVTRILRDDLRSVIEFGGLSLRSFTEFQATIRGRINRVEAGPPASRLAELLALVDAGVVEIPFGPSPRLTPEPAPGNRPVRTCITSTALERPESRVVSMVVRGHLDLPSLAHSASPLLERLYRKGRLKQMAYGDRTVGSVAISERFHPYDAAGQLQPAISVLGVLTEGVRYFTHYLPSPKSRMRAVLDAGSLVEEILA